MKLLDVSRIEFRPQTVVVVEHAVEVAEKADSIHLNPERIKQEKKMKFYRTAEVVEVSDDLKEIEQPEVTHAILDEAIVPKVGDVIIYDDVAATTLDLPISVENEVPEGLVRTVYLRSILGVIKTN